jgi:hypothetical protein
MKGFIPEKVRGGRNVGWNISTSPSLGWCSNLNLARLRRAYVVLGNCPVARTGFDYSWLFA